MKCEIKCTILLLYDIMMKALFKILVRCVLYKNLCEMNRKCHHFDICFVLVHLLSKGIAFAIGNTYDIDRIYLEI